MLKRNCWMLLLITGPSSRLGYEILKVSFLLGRKWNLYIFIWNNKENERQSLTNLKKGISAKIKQKMQQIAKLTIQADNFMVMYYKELKQKHTQSNVCIYKTLQSIYIHLMRKSLHELLLVSS